MNTPSINVNEVKGFFVRNNCYFILLLLVIISAILSPVFLTKQNIFNVLRQQVPIAFMALGALMVILTGGIDLSTGANLAVCNIVLAYLLTNVGMNSYSGLALAIPTAIAVGAVVGGFNGLLVSYLNMPAFIVSLGTMTMVRGIGYMITGGSPIRLPVNPETTPGSAGLYRFGQTGDPLIGMPWAVWAVIIVVAFFYLMMKYTSFGRLIVATGSNQTAARLAGVNVRLYKLAVFIISGALAGLAGVMVAARGGIATPTVATGFELDSIAAVVIGGATLAGGRGRVINSIVGVFILALIGNIMNLLSVPAYPRQVIQGAIIIIAVLMSSRSKEA